MSTKVTVFFLALVDLDNCALGSPVSVFALNRSGIVAAHARAEVRNSTRCPIRIGVSGGIVVVCDEEAMGGYELARLRQVCPQTVYFCSCGSCCPPPYPSCLPL